ncbi:MAG: D-alanyl-D-alanine carboxypeptidase [Candidatus Kerfeldbacteria bacterium]|nr:D-alanyl-D-alanine carboxypeptidase [Candidatus Kerfeldbacteria bacterium]
MLTNFLLSIAIITQLAKLPLPEAMTQAEHFVIVPTTTSEEANAFEWRLMPAVDTTFLPPKKIDDDHGPEIDARSSVVMDAATQQVLWQKNPDAEVSIASITKLMTALVWLDHKPADGLNHIHTFAPEDDTPGGKELNLPYGAQLTTFNVLRSSLVASYNDTALALAHSSRLSEDEFVAAMNHKAQALSMEHTTFVDPTGLYKGNISTPFDIALLAREAFSKPEIQVPASMTKHAQEIEDTHQPITVYTTDKLLYDTDLNIVGGKTGYTDEAGYCVVVEVREPHSERDVIVVVLGAPTEEGRFTTAKQIIEWTFLHYAWN